MSAYSNVELALADRKACPITGRVQAPTALVVVDVESTLRAREAGAEKHLTEIEYNQYIALNATGALDFLAGRIALRSAMRLSGVSVPSGNADVKYEAAGGPRVEGIPGMHVSIAHSSGSGVAAVGPWPVGVDLERVRPRNDSLLRYIVADGEVEAVRGPDDRPGELLTRLWTIKEATMKGQGVGLRLPPRCYRVASRGETGAYSVQAPDGATWVVYLYALEQAYIALACEDELNGRPIISWYNTTGV